MRGLGHVRRTENGPETKIKNYNSWKMNEKWLDRMRMPEL